jgi:hypothetical protein
MATIKLKDGNVILKGGKVSCTCCEPPICGGCGSISQNTGGATDLSISLTAKYMWYGQEINISQSDLFTFYINPCRMDAIGGSVSPYGCTEVLFSLKIVKNSENICVAEMGASAGTGILVAGDYCELDDSIEGNKIVPVNQILGTHSMTNLSGLNGAEPISLIVTIS